jgi:hypothetical protein
MITTKYAKLLRAATSSKLVITNSNQQPVLLQAVIKVKAEHGFDAVNNVCLLASLVGNRPQMIMLNLKNGVMQPRVMLTSKLLATFMGAELPSILARTLDKVLAISFAAVSHKVTFTFKASDAMSTQLRKLWKVFETELGLFELEMTFITNTSNVSANEVLLRGYQIPVVFN